MSNRYDFSGWATRNDMKCADGRTIRRNAFIGNDGQVVPLIWQHKHDDPRYVLGHALLENNNDGVYAYCTLNESEMGSQARELIRNGDVSHLSIYANQLKQSNSGDVIHGVIREVSLVLSGANPGAYIDNCCLTHSGEADMNEAEIYNDVEDGLEIYHSDDEEDVEYDEEYEEDDSEYDDEEYDEEADDSEEYDDDSEEEYDEDSEEEYDEDSEEYDEDSEEYEDDPEYDDKYDTVSHSADMEENNMNENTTVQDIIDGMTEEQKDVLAYIVGTILESAEEKSEEENMKHNVFESEEDYMAYTDEMMHSAMMDIISDAKNAGSMRESFLRHSDEYGITNIDYLFPDYETVSKTPEFISRKMEWVSKVMGAVHHTPFSRIKSVFADITEDEARAKGYIKGSRKKDEVFSLLKRTTDPQTIYKKQKMDRDDQLDIVDFDVVSWIKTEMRMMLDEEIARAILIGDNRPSSYDDKIQANHIRPVWTDDDLFTVHVPLTLETGETVPEAIIRLAIRSRKDYRGTGTPTMFTTEDHLTDMLLLKDLNRRYIYDNQEKLASTMRVSDIVTVPPMEEITSYRIDTKGKKWKVVAIIVNLTDYNVGADKGGAVNMFDDFDIDYNAQKYLIETRCSGALVKPYSAIAIEVEMNEDDEEVPDER